MSQFKVAVAEMDDPVLTLRTKTTSEKVSPNWQILLSLKYKV